MCPIDAGIDYGNVDSLAFVTFVEVIKRRQLRILSIDFRCANIRNAFDKLRMQHRVRVHLLDLRHALDYRDGAGGNSKRYAVEDKRVSKLNVTGDAAIRSLNV